MLFQLEALEAQNGDSLILHYGDESEPRFIVIDGGPAGVYSDTLRPRLEQLRERWGVGEGDDRQLTLDMVMVSHVDDDHINGILALFDELADLRENKLPVPYRILTLWFNSFNDVIGRGASQIFTNIPASAGAADIAVRLPGLVVDDETAAVIATVPQGQKLRDQARLLNIFQNHPVKGMIMLPESGSSAFSWNGLEITVLGPDETRLKKLWSKWEEAVQSQEQDRPEALAEAYKDQSPYNLSSIVVLVECQGKRMLLTGDARGDYILKGLARAGLLQNDDDIFEVDILKVPHHGSNRDVELNFFQRIKAQHYVISANGKHDNPDMDTLHWITEARGDDEYTIHLTNRTGLKNLEGRLQEAMEKDSRLAARIHFRADKELSLTI